MDGILGILFIIAKETRPFALPQLSVPPQAGFKTRPTPRLAVYLMSTEQAPHGLQFHNDGISFDPAGAGEWELCDNLSANCLFFLVFQSATRGFRFTGYLTFLGQSSLSCYPVEGFFSPCTIRYRTCERVYLAKDPVSPGMERWRAGVREHVALSPCLS